MILKCLSNSNSKLINNSYGSYVKVTMNKFGSIIPKKLCDPNG